MRQATIQLIPHNAHYQTIAASDARGAQETTGMDKPDCSVARGEPDHRILTARIKRAGMRQRILEATMRVFTHTVNDAPVIEDVVREAGIARGTFYKYFDSLDQALAAAGQEANERMIADIQPVYGFLKEPWRRVSVGFRIYMLRARQDPAWAAFLARMDAWPEQSAITRHMSEDFRQGQKLGQFEIDDAEAAVDFLKGASLGVVHAVSRGVADPTAYMDSAVGLALRAIGCQSRLREEAITFSRKYLDGWRPDEQAR
jgi:AcrR family transcriptional regulator